MANRADDVDDDDDDDDDVDDGVGRGLGAAQHPRTFGYGCEGVADHGWGCVYRSFQNVQSFLGAPVTPMRALVHACGREPGSWAEPAMFVRPTALAAHLLPPGWVASPFLVGSSTQWLRHTSAAEYQHHATLGPVFNVPADAAARTAFVVDDGVSCYAVVPWNRYWWWVDPHVSAPVTPHLQPRVASNLGAQPGWMVLRVTRP